MAGERIKVERGETIRMGCFYTYDRSWWRPTDPDGTRHTTWVREGWEALRPHSRGVYANFLSDEGAAGIEAAYGARLARLTALKDRYDPTSFFRMNGNIPPSGRP